ncbi:MAG: helix-turn-helix domain-containing protein [Deltaproteobacteria bacterium]|nr:helix-turn-helix domain-containing protein [Deltaproteobacteria bacterium]
MKAGHTQSKIAVIIGVHKSTISREVKRNHGQRGYRLPGRLIKSHFLAR